MSQPPARGGVLAAGTRIGSYTLRSLVGSGGNARVFRAEGPDGEEVALKLLHPGRATAEDLKRFEREFKSLDRLDHPNVIQVHRAGETEGHAWLAMEFVDGTDLSGLVDGWSEADPPDRWERTERILRGLCAGLDAVHASGIVHRDLKPSNVLVGRDGQPKLTDFGVVKGDDLFSTNLTVAGQLLGTVAFMSPEQITGEGLDARSDLYALGAMLYVLLTGQRPVVADSIASYLARHLASEPKRPQELRSDVPLHLEHICLRLLRKDPAARYATAAEVLAALDRPGEESGAVLEGRDRALSQAREVLAGLGQDGVSGLGFVGPRGSGRTAMIQAVAALARRQGLSVLRPGDPGVGVGPAVVLADDLHERQGLHLGQLIEQVRDSGQLLVWSAVAAPGASVPASPSLVPQLALLPGRVMALAPLDRPATVSLLRRLGVAGRLGPLLGRRLHEALGGHPGAVSEQLACLEAVGWLRRDGARLVAAVPLERLRNDPLPVPERLRDELLGRVRDVGPEGLRLLVVLAVMRCETTADLLRVLMPGVDDTLGALVVKGLVSQREDGVERLVDLGPSQLGRVLYEDLRPAERIALHGEIADALLSRHARRPGAMASVMADHLVRAERPEQAWPLWVQAARRAARRRDPARALALTDRALDVQARGGQRLSTDERERLQRETLALRGESLLACRQPVDARAALTQALSLGDGSDATALSARSALGAALVALGEAGEAVAVLGPLLAELGEGHPARPVALRALAEARRLRGELAESERVWRQGLVLAQELGSREPEGLCRLGLAGTAMQANQLDDARGHLTRALPLLRTARSEGLARCLCLLAELEALDGRYRVALGLADEAAELAQHTEDLETWIGALGVTADVLGLAGRERDTERLRGEIRSVQEALAVRSLLPQVSLPAQGLLAEALALEQQGAHFPALGRAEEAWRALPPSGAGGLAHRVALALCRLDPDTHRHGRASQIARAIAEELPPELAASFRARLDVAELLG